MDVLYLFISGNKIKPKIIPKLKTNETFKKTKLTIPFYSLNDRTSLIYPLFCSKLTPQKQQMMKQVNIFFNLEFI